MQNDFLGWRVVAGAFVLAVFGWGLGFYGPPVYLHAVQEERQWSVVLVSSAVTLHFLVGAVLLALGVVGWAVARDPWQLLAATLLSGAGWVAMGAAAVNAIVAPWFVARRPAALSMAYNGASIGGAVFSPLWVAAIAFLGFPLAAIVIGIGMVVTIWLLADLVLRARRSAWARCRTAMPPRGRPRPHCRRRVLCPAACSGATGDLSPWRRQWRSDYLRRSA